MRVSRRGCAAVLLLLAACRFDATLPEGVELSCVSASECPGDLGCLMGRCVPYDGVLPELEAGSVMLSFRALLGNPSASPTAAGPLAEAQLTFRTTRPLSMLPQLEAPPLDCEVRATSATGFAADCRLAAAGVEGTVEPTGTLVAVSGEEVQVTFGVSIPYDSSPPAPPDVTRVRWVLAPNGRLESSFAPQSLVSGAPGAAAALVTVRVTAGTFVLGQGLAQADGAFTLELPVVDLGVPVLTAFDAAGNASQPVDVAEVERWAAPGDEGGESPHLLRVTRVMADGVAAERAEASGALLAPDDAGVELSSTSTWRVRAQAGARGLLGFAMVWDEQAAQAYGFGGRLPGGVSTNASVRFTGEQWFRLPSVDARLDGTPGSVLAPVLWYDTVNSAVYFYEGQYRTVWKLDGFDWAPQPAAPLRVLGASGLYDTAAGMPWLCGGALDVGLLDGCLVFTRDAGWAVRPVPFEPRTGLALAWSSGAEVGWAFGGALADGGPTSDLYRLSGGTFTWVDAGSGPSPRTAAASAASADGQLLVVGGRRGAATLRDAWRFDGARWVREPDAPFDAVVMVYEPPRSRWLIAALTDDTWAFAPDAGFAQVQFGSDPLPPLLGRGFACPVGPGPCRATLASGSTLREWDVAGSQWSVHDSGTVTPPVVQAQPADLSWAPSGELGWFGFALDAGVQVWTQSPGGPWQPLPSAGLSALRPAIAPLGDAWWVSAGSDLPTNRLWRVTDAGAAAVTIPSSLYFLQVSRGPAGTIYASGFDIVSQLGHVFVYDGGSFDPLPPIEATLRWPRVALDEARGVPVMLIGLSDGTSVQRAFELIDGGWRLIEVADPEGDSQPGERDGPLFAWDVAANAFALQGNVLNTGVVDQWHLETTGKRPALLYLLATAPLKGKTPGRATALTVRTAARATSGAQVLCFLDGRWQPSRPGPAPGISTCGSEAELTRALRRRTLPIAITSAAVSGAAPAELSVDFVDAVLTWRFAGR